MITLSKRLRAIAELVPYNSCPVDVGTDHGYIPVWLIQNNICKHVVASDLNAGPLARAEQLIRELELEKNIQLILCDGLTKCPSEHIDTVLIAGMGGETIASILSAAPWTKKGRKLILQPMTKSEVLRRWLCENGYQITGEGLVEEEHRVYEFLTAESGKAPPYTPVEYWTGLFRQIRELPLAAKRLEQLTARMEQAISGLRNANSPEALDKRERYVQVHKQLCAMREKI